MTKIISLLLTSIFIISCKTSEEAKSNRAKEPAQFDFNTNNTITSPTPPTPEPNDPEDTELKPDSCVYDNDFFIIIHKNSEHRVNVKNDSEFTRIICEDNIKAMYDGDEIYVFDSVDSTFVSQELSNNKELHYKFSNQLLSIYDADELYIFNSLLGEFSKREVKNNLGESFFIVVTNDIIIYYDTDEIHTYCNLTWESFEAQNDLKPRHQTIQTDEIILLGNQRYRIDTVICEVKKSEI